MSGHPTAREVEEMRAELDRSLDGPVTLRTEQIRRVLDAYQEAIILANLVLNNPPAKVYPEIRKLREMIKHYIGKPASPSADDGAEKRV